MQWLCAEDEEDYAQERLIKEWLEREGGARDFEYKHINRQGNARNTLVRAQVRLDQQINEDGSGTFADLIAGCDGRDLECGRSDHEANDASTSAADRLENEFDLFFDAIGASEETKIWAKKSVKSAESLRQLRSLMNDEKPFEISPINLELPKRWGSFRK